MVAWIATAFSLTTFAFVTESDAQHHSQQWAQHREAIQTAVLNNDYAAFIDAIQDTPLADVIDTQDKFDDFVLMHEYRQKAADIATQLGLDELHGQQKKHGHGRDRGERWDKREKGDISVRQTIKQALESGDYTAFRDAIQDTPLAEHITSEADFVLMQEMHQARQAGDKEWAQEIAQELGLPERTEKPQRRTHTENEDL